MSQGINPPTSHEALMARIATGWQSLQAAFTAVPPAIANVPGADGWSAKDQIAHIAAWERSLTALLRGESRAAALQVPDTVFASNDIDAINAMVHDRMVNWPRDRVVAEARAAHEELVTVLSRLTWEDLQRPHDSYQPDAGHPQGDAEVINWVYGDTIDHYPEHQQYLERTVRHLTAAQAT